MFEKRAPIHLKIDSQFLQIVCESIPSWRKLFVFASKTCKKTYMNNFFIGDSSLSDFLPIFIDKT